MTLVELLVAMLLSTLLLLALVQFAAAAGATRRLQDDEALLQDQARTAFRLLAQAVGEAGFDPQPWDAARPLAGLTEETADDVAARSDRLVVRTLSDRNCFGNQNPVSDPDGRPAFFIRETSFDRSGGGQLTRRCRYGPTPTRLTLQVRRQGQVPGVESFQMLYGLDGDHDGNIEGWAPAGAWGSAQDVLGVRVGLLLRGEVPVAESEARTYRVLDEHVTVAADGLPRRVLEFTVAIRSRTG